MISIKFTEQHEPLIAALGPSLQALALRGTPRAFRKNAMVIREGERGDALFVLLQGSAKVFATDEQGREIIYGNVVAGDWFGEMALDGGPRSASVMTLEPSLCAVVERDALREHLAEEPQFALELVAQVIRRARAATEIARSMALKDVYGRMVAYLESRYGAGSAGAPVELKPLTHQTIASCVGASREMVSRLLKDLEKGGYVQLGVKRIVLMRKLPARW